MDNIGYLPTKNIPMISLTPHLVEQETKLPKKEGLCEEHEVSSENSWMYGFDADKHFLKRDPITFLIFKYNYDD